MPPRTSLPEPVEQAISSWLEHHDRLAPGLIEGLYLVGSVSLDDWRPGSDIDIVAFTTDLPDLNGVEALRSAHLGATKDVGGIDIDGPRLIRSDVTEPPTRRLRPWTLGGEFHHDDACFELNPVTWHTLAAQGRAVRGPEPADLGIATTTKELTDFVRANVDGYWRSVANTVETAVRDENRSEFRPEMTSWCVLGLARMLFTVRTGDVASKTAAGHWLADTHPEHRPIVEHALSIRQNGTTTPDDRETAAATATYLNDVIELVIGK